MRLSRLVLVVVPLVGLLGASPASADLLAPPPDFTSPIGVAPSGLPVPVEASRRADIASSRTTHSKTWPAEGGGRVTRVSTEPLYWKDRKGELRSFDLRVKRRSDGRSFADVGGARALLPTGTGAEGAVDLSDGADRLRLTLEGVRGVRGVADGNEAMVYADVRPGVTRMLQAVPGGVKEDLVLSGPSAERDFSYRLQLSEGLLPRIVRGGDVEVKRGSKVVFRIPRGVLYEQGNPTDTAPAADYRLERVGQTWRLGVSADTEWTRDAGRKWPLVLDPTVSVDRIAPLSSVGGSLGRTDAAWETVGWKGWDGDGFAEEEWGTRFPVQPSMIPGVLTSRMITGAKLHVYASGGGGVSGSLQDLSADSWITVGGALKKLPISRRTFTGSGPVAFDVTREVRQWNRWNLNPSTGRKAEGLDIWPGIDPPYTEDARTSANFPYISQNRICAHRSLVLCEELYTEVATKGNPDPAKRPYLDIYSAAPAQAGSEIGAPAEGKLSSRFVELFAKSPSANVTTATFEYIAGDTREWEPIPLSALRNWETGAQPTSAEIPVSGTGTNRSSKSLVWDLNKTPGAQVDGPVHVRALLDAGTAHGGGMTPERNFRIDRKNPETSSQEEVGPAKVDLLTGDVAVTETDAEIKAFINDLQLTRTYHSRGGSPRTTDMFGPGWTSSFEVDGGADMPYRGIYNFTDVKEDTQIVDWSIDDSNVDWEYFDPADLQFEPVFETTRFETTYAVLEEADGSKISFRKDGSDWVLDEEHRDLKVASTPGGFSVTDADGGVTMFEPDATGSPNYRPISYAQPGSNENTTFEYTIVDGRKRLLRVLAPKPNAGPCSEATWSAGCRALTLGWGEITVAGKIEKRVMSLSLRAVDPSGSSLGTVQTIADYAYDAMGRLKKVSDPRAAGGLPTEYAYDADGRLTTYTPAGERPWTFAYRAIDGDEGKGRVRSITRKTPAGVDATTTFVYEVPLSGATAPYDLSAAAVTSWGQTDPPRTGTAVFPPDAVPTGTGMPSSWNRATINYLGVHGQAVNVADPSGNITTSEYDKNGNVLRELSARNRERALAASGSTSARSHELDKQYAYAENGVDLVDTVGPEHEIRRPDGTMVLARTRTRTSYDAGKPSSISGDQHLVTERRVGALRTSDNVNIDERVTRYEYSDGASIRGWQVKQPLSTTVGFGTADAATTKYEYDTVHPLLIQKRMPKAGAGPDSQATNYAYYDVSTRLPTPSWCLSGSGTPNLAAAAGQLCAKLPDAQPASGPSVPGTFYRYSVLWDQVEERRATDHANVAGSTVRTTSTGRDALGRETSRSVSATTGRAIPTITTTYNGSTGRLMTSTSAALGGEPARSLQRSYDDNGRLSSYTDADGGTTSYGYDLAGRLDSVQDPRGTRALSYDSRDLITGVVDSKLSGPITAERDADGNLTKQTLPGGLVQSKGYDENGDLISLKWEKASGCASTCIWVDNSVTRDSQTRIATQRTATSDQTFGYDGVGRVASTQEQRGDICTVRSYEYDKNSNRSNLTTKLSGAGGACGTGTSVSKASTVDGVDRLTGTGYSYDALGRTTAVPGADMPSGTTTSLAYDVDDLVASTTAGAATQSLTRDPARRLRSDTSQAAGLSSTTSVLRYGSDEDVPTARTGAWGWERYVGDVDGTQLATVGDAGTVTWELSDIHGDVVTTAIGSGSAPAATTVFDEFGNEQWAATPVAAKGLRHAWLGGHGKHTAFVPGGLVHMGVRVYNPRTGRFLQVDPIDGGSANGYEYVYQDPMNRLDLDGRATWEWLGAAVGWGATVGGCMMATTGIGAAMCVAGLAGNTAGTASLAKATGAERRKKRLRARRQ